MSIYFIADATELWNPASLTGRVYRDQANSVARLLNVDSGLGEVVADEVQVEIDPFKLFAGLFAKLVAELGPSSPSSAHLLLDGCFAITAAMAQKLGSDLPDDSHLATLRDLGKKLIG